LTSLNPSYRCTLALHLTARCFDLFQSTFAVHHYSTFSPYRNDILSGPRRIVVATMDDQLTADYSTVDFATATNAITLTPQQSAAVQDAGRLNKNLLENFKDANMQGVAFNAYAYSLNWTQTGCYRPGSLPVALAFNDTCLPGFHCKPHSHVNA
jgi:hypothetical protein